MVVTHNEIINAIVLAENVAYLNAQARVNTLKNGEIPCDADDAKAIEIEQWITILQRAEAQVENECITSDDVWELIQKINEQYRGVDCDVSRTFSRRSSSSGSGTPPSGYVERVLGVNVDNSNPSRPVIRIYPDGITIMGSGTDADPFYAVGGAGSGTVNLGTQYRIAYYAATGTAVSQAAAITPNRALISDANGVPTHSSVTAAVLAYLDATSSVQTQLDSKMANPMTTGGDVIYGGLAGLPTRLANGSAGQVLQSNGTTLAPSWATIGSGNTNTIYLTKAALIILESGSTLDLTTRYRVTDATPYVMEVVPEAVNQLGQSATIIDDVYSGHGNWNPTTDNFIGTIYDGDGNTWNGCLPSGTTLGASSYANVFLTSGTNVFGASARRNIIKQGATGFILGDFFQNTTIEPDVLGADYTASPDYDFLYNGESCTIFYDGTDNYHMYPEPANDRFVLTNMTTLAVSYIGGSGTGDMILASAQTNSGLKTFLDGSFGLRNIANTFTSFFANAATAARTWTLQNRNGTLADDTDLALKADVASPTFTGTVTTPAIIVSSETASRVAIIDGSKNVKSADTATYPSLTELSYLKGVTSAIQTQINALSAPIASVGNGTAVTGTTANTYSKGLLIPANSRGANQAPQIDCNVTKTGAAGNLTLRFYWNTTNDLAGTPILIGTSATAAALGFTISRVLSIEVAAGTGNGTKVQAATVALSSSWGAITTTASILAIDWTADGYLICAVQNASAADSSVCNMIKLH